MQLLAKLVRRSTARLFAVGHDDNEAWLVSEVEHVCGLRNADGSGVFPAGVRGVTTSKMDEAAFSVGRRSSLTLH